jgi:hypothetical protein
VSRIFGSINQLGYVVRDIQAAMVGWLRHGVDINGPKGHLFAHIREVAAK